MTFNWWNCSFLSGCSNVSAAGSVSDLDKTSNTDDVSISFYSPIYIDAAHLPFFLQIPEALRGRIQLFVKKTKDQQKRHLFRIKQAFSRLRCKYHCVSYTETPFQWSSDVYASQCTLPRRFFPPHRGAMTLRCTRALWASLLVIQCQLICLNKVSHRCTYWIHGGQYWQWHMRPGCFSFFYLWRAWIDGRWATLVSLYCSCHSFPLCLRSPFLASTPGGCWGASLQRFFFFFFFSVYLLPATSKWVYQL